jgi:hypothetical protein
LPLFSLICFRSTEILLPKYEITDAEKKAIFQWNKSRGEKVKGVRTFEGVFTVAPWIGETMLITISVSSENSIPMRLRKPIATRGYGSFRTGLRPKRMPSTTSRTMDTDVSPENDHELGCVAIIQDMVNRIATGTLRAK